MRPIGITIIANDAHILHSLQPKFFGVSLDRLPDAKYSPPSRRRSGIKEGLANGSLEIVVAQRSNLHGSDVAPNGQRIGS